MSTKTVPVIDFAEVGLSVKDENDLEKSETAKIGMQLYEALSTMGVAYISNSGISWEKFNAVNKVTKEFYEFPQDLKLRYCKKDSLFGYHPSGVARSNPAGVPDYKEQFRVSGPALEDERTDWPEISGFKENHLDFMTDIKSLTLRVFKILGIAMNLKDPDAFCNSHQLMNQRGNSGSLTTLHYPPINDEAQEKIELRVGQHTDNGSLTLLFQDFIGGLQIKNEEGCYIDAPPVPGTIILIVAECLKLMTGGRLKPCVHRVILPTDPEKRRRDRYSMGYFALPDDDVPLDEVDIVGSEVKSSATESITAFQFHKKNFAVQYYK